MIEAELPDGTVLEFPEGTGQDVIQRVVKQHVQKASRLEKLNRDLGEFNPDPTADMTVTQKFLAGVGKGFVDIGRGVRQYLPKSAGGLTAEEIAHNKRIDAPLMNTGAGVAGNVVGNVAAALPAAFVPGANTMLGSAAVGAAYGALQPGEDAGERLKNIGVGGIGGAAIPAALRAGRVAKSFVEPLYQTGREKIIARALRSAAGGQADDALRNLQNARELVPGSMPTVGQAAGVPSLAALERTATATNPTASNLMATRMAAQNEARRTALQGVAGDDAALAALREARDQAAQTAYGTAKQSDAMRRGLAIEQANIANQQNLGLGSLANLPVKTEARVASDALRPTKELLDLAKRPSFQTYIDQAKRLAADKGQDIGDPLTSIDGLHYIKLAIDDALQGTPTTSLARNAKAAAMDMKTLLTNEMDKLSPVYGIAREAFKQASKPINQMEIGQEIVKKATDPLTGNLRPSSYARALSDETAQRVTGMPTATMQGSMTPEAFATLQAVKDDLGRANFAQTAGRGVGSDTVQKLAYTNMLDQAGIPSMLRNFGPAGIIGNIGQRFGQLAYKDANEQMAAQLAESMLNPQEAARIMQLANTNPKVEALVNTLRRVGVWSGAALPGVVQSNQQ